MDYREYCKQVAELEYHEDKAWRTFCQARDADLPQANALHRQHQRLVERICKLHTAWLDQVVNIAAEDRRAGAA